MRLESFAVIPSFTAHQGKLAAKDPQTSGAAVPTHWYDSASNIKAINIMAQ